VTITLSNTCGRLVAFVLPHETYCHALPRCVCIVRRDGARLASSLTIAAGSRAEGVDESVLGVASIRAAVRAGGLTVERDSASPNWSEVPTDGGPAGAPTTPVEVLHEPRIVGVENRSGGGVAESPGDRVGPDIDRSGDRDH
jgi:hypothetical protein